jgi:hypothetical protein
MTELQYVPLITKYTQKIMDVLMECVQLVSAPYILVKFYFILFIYIYIYRIFSNLICTLHKSFLINSSNIAFRFRVGQIPHYTK